jgi:hypothetical protein
MRYEREAVALRKIIPEVHVTLLDMFKFIAVGIVKDWRAAWGYGVFLKESVSICIFRVLQYYGAYKGNHIHRQISQATKMKYFYPRVSDMNVSHLRRDHDKTTEAQKDA